MGTTSEHEHSNIYGEDNDACSWVNLEIDKRNMHMVAVNLHSI